MNHEQPVPVLIGISQLEQRSSDPTRAKEPLDLMIDAVRAAAADAGSNELLTRATSVRVIRGIWPYKNPARVDRGSASSATRRNHAVAVRRQLSCKRPSTRARSTFRRVDTRSS